MLFDPRSRGYEDNPPGTLPPPAGKGKSFWTNSKKNEELAATRIKTFLCPAAQNDPNNMKYGIVAAQEIEINGLHTCYPYWSRPPYTAANGFPAGPWGLTNYLGVAGARGILGSGATGEVVSLAGTTIQNADWSMLGGLFDNRSHTSLARVPDGTSNTLMFGEIVGDSGTPQLTEVGPDSRQPQPLPPHGPGQVIAGYSWMGSGAQITVCGLGGPDTFYYGQFSSAHGKVVNFAFADGSVHPLVRHDFLAAWQKARPNAVNDPAWLCLQELAGEHDGQEANKSIFEP
jgi:prepilin-type processing-associated H-X9-DG protein